MAQFFRDGARTPATSSWAWPPGYPFVPLPPSPPWAPSPPSPTSEDDKPSTGGGVVAGLVVGFLACLLVLAVVYRLYKGRRESRVRARAATRPPPQAEPPTHQGDERRELRRASAPSPTARLPAFTYNQSVKHKVTGTGEEASTCSVCLGAYQHGESVRLLPACLHLFHVECIDPWLDAHSTCPICRSDTDPTMEITRLPPV